MSGIYVCGLGAVSPAGWTVAALRDALRADAPLPVQQLPTGGRQKTLPARLVPAPLVRPGFLAHPRLRRTSPITHYLAAAGLEALAGLRLDTQPVVRLGLICCFQSGCVQYSCRFFEETLKDPASASPLVFPETVFAAPTSHAAALLGNVTLATSLVGDPATFLQGLALATEWLAEQRVDRCLVIGSEESHWMLADALWHFQHSAVFTAGAGAVCLAADERLSLGVQLTLITDAHTFSSAADRAAAAKQMRAQLPAGSSRELLVDGLDSSPRTDAAEQEAWREWPGARLSPKRILGEGLMASAAWQCVTACDAVAHRQAPSALVSLVGCNQQAIGAQFTGHIKES
jgi:hypothetical protein